MSLWTRGWILKGTIESFLYWIEVYHILMIIVTFQNLLNIGSKK